jgi:CheY-like chemotaxis protein
VTPELLTALAELAWPVLAAVVLVALLPTLVHVARSRALSIKYGEMEISIQDASQQLIKQVEDLQTQVQRLAAPAAPAAARAAAAAATGAPRRRLILWVDEKPENNAHEIAKLQGDGWDIATARSTQAALDKLAAGEEPAVVISDMARREGLAYRRTAGLDLIRAIRSRKLGTPVFIYASADAERTYGSEVRAQGGDGITASPLELFRLVAGTASKSP